MENQQYFQNYRKVFLLSTILNVLVFVFLILVFFVTGVKNPVTDEEYGVYQLVKYLTSDEIRIVIDGQYNRSFSSVFYFMMIENTIFTFLFITLAAALISSFISIILGVYHYVNYKNEVAKIVEKRYASKSYRKFKRKTAWYSENNVSISILIVVAIVLLLTQLCSKNIDFQVWILMHPLGIYFCVFRLFEVPMNAGLIVYLSILLVGSIISKIIGSKVRQKIYYSLPPKSSLSQK